MDQSIDSLVDGLVATFESSGYTQRSVQAKMCTLHTIAKMHKKEGFYELNEEIISLFLSNAYERYQSGAICRIRYMYLVKTADYLMQY